MGKRQTGFNKETLETIGKHFAALVDYAKDKEDLTAKQVYQQIYGDDDISNIEDKISKMKRGESITAYDVMKIQAWKNLSLDWLVLGKGNPPPELQEIQEMGSSDELPVSNTVRGLLYSLMCLSLAGYTSKMKIETHGHDYMYHDVNISFSFAPLGSLKQQCDTVSYLIQGLLALSCSKFSLIEVPNNDKVLFSAKINKYNEILDSIPPNQTLDNYECELRTQHVTPQFLERFFPNNLLPYYKTGRDIFLPEKY